VGQEANAGAYHHTVISPSLELPLDVGSGCFIGPKEAQVRKPSAFGHLLHGHGDAGMDFLGVHARRQHGTGEIHRLGLLTYEQNTRHLTSRSAPRFANFAEIANGRKAKRITRLCSTGSGSA
jgi:hypothetical protein